MNPNVPYFLRRVPGCLAAAGLVLGLGLSANALAQDDPTADVTAEDRPVPAMMARLADRSLLTDATLANDTFVAVGQRGHILLSSDGVEWEQVPVPANSTLTAVDFADDQNGWAGGHDATLLRTRDGGRTWELQQYEPLLDLSVLDILFLDAERGFAIGNFGYFLHTEDGGETWQEDVVVSPEEHHLHSIIQADNGDLLIAGEFGKVYRSTDGGYDWEVIQTPYAGSFFKILQASDGRLLVAGLRGNVFVSNDMGRSWERFDAGTEFSLYGGNVTEDGEIILVGENARILVTRDNLSAVHQYNHPAGTPLTHVIPRADGDYLIFDEEGVRTVESRHLTP